MSEVLIVVFPRGQLSAEDKEHLSANGVIAVEADTPDAVKQLHLMPPLISTEITGDAIVQAALASMSSQRSETDGGTITGAGRVKSEFVRLLAAAIKEPKP